MSEKDREYFRIDVYNTPIALNASGHHYKGYVKDISANGIFFKLESDEQFTSCTCTFSLLKETFTIEAKFIRKEESGPSDYGYACTFENVNTKTHSKLM